jgi:hypothetical protein
VLLKLTCQERPSAAIGNLLSLLSSFKIQDESNAELQNNNRVDVKSVQDEAVTAFNKDLPESISGSRHPESD